MFFVSAVDDTSALKFHKILYVWTVSLFHGEHALLESF
jgi:hypothetical protein